MSVDLALPPQQQKRNFFHLREDIAEEILVFFVVVFNAIPLALFLATGGIANFQDLAGMLTGIGKVTGILSGSLMVTALLAAARIPWIDHHIGHDKALLFHAWIGKWVFLTLTVHVATLIAGVAIAMDISATSALTSMLSDEDLLHATLATVALAVVGVTSILQIRRRLGYEIWQILHLLSYPALLIALPHQLSATGTFGKGFAHWYWLAIWVVAIACFIVFRLAKPLLATFSQQVTVDKVVPETYDTASIWLRMKDSRKMGLQAGQFVNWRFLSSKLWWHPHPFSTSHDDVDGCVRITVRNLGTGTARLLSEVKPGMRVAVEGPYGVFCISSAHTKNLVLIGIGVGMGPVRALLDSAPDFERVAVIQRMSSEQDLLFADEIRATCASHPNAIYVELVGHRGSGWMPQQHDGQKLIDFVPWLAEADVFSCGPDAVSQAVIAEAIASGVPEYRIHTERFSW